MAAPAPSSYDGDYGGEKQPFPQAADPTYDHLVAETNQAFNDLAMGTLTWATFRIVLTGAGTSAPTIAAHTAQWGATDDVKPTVAYVGVGIYTLTWASEYLDQRGNLQPVNIRFLDQPHVRALRGDGSTVATKLIARLAITAANVVKIYVYEPTLTTLTNLSASNSGDLLELSGR